MVAAFNHTLVHCRDNLASATFLTEIFDLEPPVHFGHFEVVTTGNGASLDFISTDEDFDTQHYAFLVTEEEFDGVLERVQARDLEIWADPGRNTPGEISTNHGRGFYFLDPDGHFLEALTRPYLPW